MTTDILIPLGKGSRHDNLELKYCLRSVEKHLRNVGNIFIVGIKPDWLTNVIQIPAHDSSNNWQRAHNIYRKIIAGINYLEDLQFYQTDKDRTNKEVTLSFICLSDNFLFMNDDHYLLSDYDAWEFPYYHRGQVKLNNFSDNIPALNQYRNTITHLGAILDYDVHCPILYNKKLFRQVFEGLHWPEYGYCIKSMYANKWAVGSTIKFIECEDLKFHEPLMKETIYKVLEGRQWFSIGDRCLKSGDMKTVLQELYPSPSKYEL